MGKICQQNIDNLNLDGQNWLDDLNLDGQKL